MFDHLLPKLDRLDQRPEELFALEPGPHRA